MMHQIAILVYLVGFAATGFSQTNKLDWQSIDVQQLKQAQVPEVARPLFSAITTKTNRQDRETIIAGYRRIDPLAYDLESRRILRAIVEHIVADPTSNMTDGGALILLARFKDQESSKTVRGYASHQAVEIPADLTMELHTIMLLNIALAVTGDPVAEKRICDRIEYVGYKSFGGWGADLLSRKSVQLALLRWAQHPDAQWNVPYDYELCWSLRLQREPPKCHWLAVHLSCELLAEALHIEIKRAPNALVFGPDEARRIISEARKQLFPGKKSSADSGD